MYRESLELVPNAFKTLENLAALLTRCPDPQDPRHRGGSSAGAGRGRAVASRPGHLRRMEFAQFRAGNWRGAVEASRKTMQLPTSGADGTWLILAVAQWQLGERESARAWYDRGAAWMERNTPDGELSLLSPRRQLMGPGDAPEAPEAIGDQ